ncbi:stress responsive A/B barrel domain-domain-containing protein [Leucosporidium creatinivorum]|uniref:Stress responsive A/B barrel domain-domain-containing protein n=1 Tax=Leucosporidium creatinivorum TaxID=106004 RepID=A0A1Y2EGS6_9BASI|nr:stress responsive A/B barrel domain-domain-containing protein [Leucosporidium creatinivorum]
MPIIHHIVSFAYNPDVSSAEKALIGSRFLALKDTCLSPSDNKTPYILEVTGGSNNSPEGAAKGFDHSFVVTFATEEDRDYYLKDPAHDAFKATLAGKLKEVYVFDFAPGQFEA